VVAAAFRALGLNWRYISVDVGAADLAAAVAGLRAMRFGGFHVTKPHKIAAVALVDELTPTASAAGAVNCVVRTDRGYLGDNTDGTGLTRAVRAIRDIRGMDVVLLGAGGAARAIAARLVADGAARVTIYNRTEDRAAALARMVAGLGAVAGVEPWPVVPVPVHADLVVNATSLGMAGSEWSATGPIDWSSTPEHTVAADAVIVDQTDFVTAAERAGRTVVTGLDMLVEQAAESLLVWTGLEPDMVTIRSVAVAALRR
jgi:shikimate dehydrogenase